MNNLGDDGYKDICQRIEAKPSVITVYGTHTCPDCSFVEDQIKDDDGFRLVDIGSHVKNLKAFMALRDSNPVFDSVKNKGIGIPAFVH
jgi:glutaredoxin-related protein